MVKEYFIKISDTYIQISGVIHSYKEDSLVFINKDGDIVLTVFYDKLDFIIDLNRCNDSKLLVDSNCIELKYE